MSARRTERPRSIPRWDLPNKPLKLTAASRPQLSAIPLDGREPARRINRIPGPGRGNTQGEHRWETREHSPRSCGDISRRHSGRGCAPGPRDQAALSRRRCGASRSRWRFSHSWTRTALASQTSPTIGKCSRPVHSTMAARATCTFHYSPCAVGAGVDAVLIMRLPAMV
jgi:hypothetical protein